MQEFVFISDDEKVKSLLPSTISTELDSSNKFGYLISNKDTSQAEIFAPEIDWFVEISQSKNSHLSKAVSILYETRAVKFDLSLEQKYMKEISNTLLLVGDGRDLEHFYEQVKDDFSVVITTQAKLLNISGDLGSLKIEIEGKKDSEFAQAVLFYDDLALERYSGVEMISKYKTSADLIAFLHSRLGEFIFPSIISYDSSICQHHERREKICSTCVDLCPSFGVVTDPKTNTLDFRAIDCLGCGGCIAACPSGAIDFTKFPRNAFKEVAQLYEGLIPVVIPDHLIGSFKTPLPAGFVPFIIEGVKFMSEYHLMVLLQESGSQVIFYTDFVSKGTKDAAMFVNTLWNKLYNQDGFLIAMNEDELQSHLQNAMPIAGSRVSVYENGMSKREMFANRVKLLIGDKDLGNIPSGQVIEYGVVDVKESDCTLCSSCVDACNTGALVANLTDNSLRFKAPNCTQCGYCLVSCPEKCMTMTPSGIDLKKEWFEEKTLAKDTLFACVECGKEFATTKSVMKIANMMAPLFASDRIKERTLYCCADCKPKVMLKQLLEQEMSL